MKTIGVIGAGTMGSGIAQVAASAGQFVILVDAFPQALEKAKYQLQKSLYGLVAKGKLEKPVAEQILERILFSSDFQALRPCDLVIEAIVENLEIKKATFQKVEALVSENCILASNTSSLSITSIAASCQKPERFLGLHFFNPAQIMKLVEVIPAIQSKPGLGNEMADWMRAWGKIPVLAKDTPAFIVNRVARSFYGEALRIFDEGLADMATIDWAMKSLAGFPMGPFELMDFIGHDVNFVVTESVFQAFYGDPRYMPSFTQKRLLEAGFLGKKSGKGFYEYGENSVKPEPNTSKGLGEKIWKRIVAMLINEAAEAAQFGIASPEDIDMAMTRGVNYPKGLFQWAKEWGYKQVVKELDDLFAFYHDPRYRCSAWLRNQQASVSQ
jgi:3-hydroxybutyryl-CoA dehydrogenase